MRMQGETIQDRRHRELVERLTGERGGKELRAVTQQELDTVLRRIAVLEGNTDDSGPPAIGRAARGIDVAVDANFGPLTASTLGALSVPMTSEELDAAPTMEDFNKLRADVMQTRTGSQALLRLIRSVTDVIDDIVRQTR